ncbi:CCR4-NOT core subunit NOT3 [Nakaseomyces bracarensis]|uniref:CCR4-NOT core subunit NOT3 n=1 Tax=Nakaseomyces bracarensis TaxID=273131 RepID=UPI0038717F65
MAHRKLQQEIDKVFKKINEGLEIFNSYYERHESCTNNPSQKDKLESDLKREVKKLQRLREQIKSWQSSPDIKDKDSLLEYRRSVEVAMEQYKAVEKASKEKAYSNISLKKSDTLGPQEKEIKEVSDYLSQQIEEIERQYEAAQVEIDRLIVLNKKKKTATTANEDKKDQLKSLQLRYRWHQQQMELALRLLANEELDPQKVKSIQDDINFFVESNQEPDFVEDETIYDSLDLQSNEAIAHEVAQYFASQSSEDNLANNETSAPIDLDSIDTSKLSKKELRKLEREAKKAAKVAAKNAAIATANAPPTITIPAAKTVTEKSPLSANSEIQSDLKSQSASPTLEDNLTTNSTPKSPTNKNTILTTPSSNSSTTSDNNDIKGGHTHIHQGQNGTTSSTVLKPAVVPARPAGELKWSVAASHGLEKERKSNPVPAPPALTSRTNSSAPVNETLLSTATSVNTPKLHGATLAERLEKAHETNTSSPNITISNLANLENDKGDSSKDDEPTANENYQSNDIVDEKSETVEEDIFEECSFTSSIPLLSDGYVHEAVKEQALVDEEQETPEEESAKMNRLENLRNALHSDYEELLLPNGIQAFIMGMELSNNHLLNNSKCSYRYSRDICQINRLDPVPIGVNPPSPLDSFRSTQQWDTARYSLWSTITAYNENAFDGILKKFEELDMFTLFYNYYFAITPLEKEISFKVLTTRDWRVANNGVMWFLRQGEPKLVNDGFEIGDYKIFKLDDWTVIEKVNFKLDYSILKNSTVAVEKPESNNQTPEENKLSHGQQLLQQLKQGKGAA